MIKKLIPPRVKYAINLAIHSGNRFLCPFCGYSAKDLAPLGLDLPVLKEKKVIGAGLRKAGCYKCGSTDRERLVWAYLKDELKLFEQKDVKILHMAPEVNLSRTLRAMDFDTYVCGDLFTEGYEYPDYVENMNVLSIPYEDNFFDLIICNHLLEHVPNDIDAMKELYRVLKPNGKAILLVPISKNSETTLEDFSVTDPREREQVFGQFDHLRIYGQDYVDRLSSVGFKVDRINISVKYEKLGLNADEDVIVGSKN